jgi:KaiC/GvpD/RAD55 family RecA-like ATPase
VDFLDEAFFRKTHYQNIFIEGKDIIIMIKKKRVKKKYSKKRTVRKSANKKTSRKKVHKNKDVEKKIQIVKDLSAPKIDFKEKIPEKIFTKKVLPKKNVKIMSGIPGFDKLCNKGFTKNTTNIIVGGSGSGKTIFAAQSMLDGIKKGEPCLYITFEEKKEQFYSNMRNFGWDLEKYEKKGLFNFLEYTPEKVKVMLEEGGGIIESIVLNKKISRVVIDSISSFTLLFKNEIEKRASSLELFNLLRRWEVTTILTLEEDPMEELNPDAKAIQFEADSIINLYFIRKKKSRSRYLEILKMRGTKHSRDIYHFEIGKKGINIGKKVAGDFKKE